MNFGISFLPDCSPETKSPTQYFDDVLKLSRVADEAGMRWVKMTEHYLHPYGGYCPSPLGFLSAVAAQTQQIRLMTGCALPNFHHPVKLASYAAMVDAISHGRVELGFARAYLPYEFNAFDVPMDGSRERFEATVAAVVRLWTEEAVTIDTPFFAFENATILPRPVQTPHPPVHIAAVKTPESFLRIGTLGHGLLITPSGTSVDRHCVELYREAFAEAHPGRTSSVIASLPLVVRRDEREAVRVADPLLAEYLRVWASAVDVWDDVSSSDYRSYTGLARYVRSLSAKDLRITGSAMVGSPGRVAERIAAFASDVGVDHFLWQLDFGASPLAESEETLDLFLSDVAPALTTSNQLEVAR